MSAEGHFDFDDYLSPFTWRYGSAEMRALWSEAGKRRMWRRIWVALAAAQSEYGLVSAAQVADLSGVRIGFVRGPDSLSVDAYDRSQVESPLAAGDALAFCPGPDGGEPAVLLELCRRLAALDAGSDHG